MTTGAILNLLQRIIDHHERRDPPEGLEIVPVLMAELPHDLELVEAALRHYGGVLVNAEKSALGVVGQMDNFLTTVVETALSRLAGPAVRIESRDQRVHALLETETAESPGFKMLQGIACALFDEGLRGSRLAAIAYDEAPLEFDAKRAVWAFLTQHIRGLKIGEVTTLVVLVGTSDLDYELHLQRESSAIYRIAGSTCDERKTWAADIALIRGLATPEKPCVFFLGAGFSASSGLPLGETMRNEALQTMLGATGEEDPKDLAAQFHEFVERSGRLLPSEEGLSRGEFINTLTLERVLREELRVAGLDGSATLQRFRQANDQAGEAPGSSVPALLEIVRRSGRVAIVTVNFDTLLERQNLVKMRVFASDEQFPEAVEYVKTFMSQGGVCPLLKLHGTIEDPRTIIGDVDTVALGLAPEKVDALEALTDPSVRIPWVYVGYSFRDLDIEPTLGMRRFAEGTNETWVMPFVEPTVEQFAVLHRNQSWSDRGLRGFDERVINETSDVFFDELSTVWPA